MAQLQTFWFLLMQTTFFGWGLIAPVATAMVLLRSDRKRVSRLLLLPAIWIAPLAIAGAFVEPEDIVKTASWLGYVGQAAILAYLGVAAWSIYSLRGARGVAAGCSVINAPFVLLGAFVIGMASSGDWL